MHHPTDTIAHTTAFLTPVVEHWLERDIAQWVHHEGSTRLSANALTTVEEEKASDKEEMNCERVG